jgi:hypothetical protein
MNPSQTEFEKQFRATYKDKADVMLRALPVFTISYQSWYSEAKVLVRQIVPDRRADFVSY